jgi:hypothetical protein
VAKVNPAARWEADLQDQLASAFAKRDAWLEANGPVEEVVVTENENGDRLYDYTLQRENGGSQNLYWGNHSKQVTAAELQEIYNADDNARLRESFGSFDNYMAYMDERQDLISNGEYKADWWDTGTPLVGSDGLSGALEDRELEQSVMQEGARQGEIGYNEQSDIFNSLYEKYTGESTTKYLDNGAKYEWNGSSFVMTQEAFGPHYGTMFAEALPGIVLSAGLGPALANWGLTGTLNSAASGALGSAISQGMLNGKIDLEDALLAGLQSGALAGFSDYLSDSANMFPDSDLGGMLGDGGFLNKLGFDTDYLSTSAGISALDWAANNPIIDGAQQLLAPILNSELGQGGLDLLTSALMGGYNDEWRDKYDPETGGLNSSATAEDFENFNRYNAAIDAGNSALNTGQSLDGSPIWDLDERYFWTTTPRDPNSDLVGILEQPLESEGGMEAYIAFLNAANEANKDSEETGEGEEVSGSGTSTGNGDGEGLEGEGDKGEGDGMLPELTGGGSGTSGNASGSGAGLDQGGEIPVTGNADQVIIDQLIEAIGRETDPDVIAGLQQTLDSYLQTQGGAGSDVTLGDGSTGSDVVIGNGDDTTTLPPADNTTIPPADTNVLPPGDSGGGGATGLLGLATGGDGLPPIWTDLDPYTTIKRYKSQRTKLLDGMMASLTQQNSVAPASFVPKSPSEKELFEAGMFS